MHRTWLVLLVLCAVVLAGCSAPGGSPPTTDGTGDVTYPADWGPEGPENATQAIQNAQELVDGNDFVERWITIQETEAGMEAEYLIVVTEARVDRDQERLLNLRRFYLVDTGLASSVAESGGDTLADRRPNEVRRAYLNSSGGLQYHRLENRSPRITQMQSGDFATATDQPLPAALMASVPVFESASYTNATQIDAGVGYSISNVGAFHVENGTGGATVRSDGLVTGYDISEANPESEEAFRYDVEVGDVSIDRPEWASGGDSDGTPSE